MKTIGNAVLIAAAIPLIIGGLLAVGILFLGAAGTVVARRLQQRLTT